MGLFSIFKVGNNPGKWILCFYVSFNSLFLPTPFFFLSLAWHGKRQGTKKKEKKYARKERQEESNLPEQEGKKEEERRGEGERGGERGRNHK